MVEKTAVSCSYFNQSKWYVWRKEAKKKFGFYTSIMKFDMAGSNFDIVIGGVNENVKNEHTRPEIQLYLTHLTFTAGGNSNGSLFWLLVWR